MPKRTGELVRADPLDGDHDWHFPGQGAHPAGGVTAEEGPVQLSYPESISCSGRTIARRSFCIHAHAV